jgi:hypothetical protein
LSFKAIDLVNKATIYLFYLYKGFVTGRQSHIGYTSQEKRIIPSNCTNGYIDEDLKLRKEEAGKGRKEVSYIYTLRTQVT